MCNRHRNQCWRSLEQSICAVLMGSPQLAIVSSCLQLTTEVCLIPNISVKNGPVLPTNPCLKRWGWCVGAVEEDRKKVASTTRRRGAALNEIGWRENEAQHAEKIESRLRSRVWTWKDEQTVKKEKKQASSPSFAAHAPQLPPRATADHPGTEGHAQPSEQMSPWSYKNLLRTQVGTKLSK